MATLVVTCPVCHRNLSAGDADAGAEIACPDCESPVPLVRPRVIRVQPTPPKKKERWLPQVLGVMGGMCFLALAGCGLLGFAVYDHFTAPDFKPHNDAVGRFRCEFPGVPYRANPLTWTANGPLTMPIVAYERTLPDEAYAVIWIDLPKEVLAAGADSILNDFCTAASNYQPMIAGEVSREPIEVGGHPGYELICSVVGSQGKGIYRAILVGPRLYLLFVGGGFIQPDSARARHFLDSFELTSSAN